MELKTQKVAGDGVSPDSWLLVLHGIYGAGRNWGAVARSLAEARPDWGTVLVDLRQHGGSQGFPPPHTLEAAAGDLAGVDTPGAVRGVLGHSFGGKVALLHARDRESVGQVWVIDSTPAPRDPDGSAWRMLEILRELPEDFEERGHAVEGLVERGVKRPIALWMATNLEWRDDRYRWRINLDDMEALLRDFFRADLWDVVESPPERLTVHMVKATESTLLDEEAVSRIRSAAETTGRVHLHKVEGGHWLNADNPDALVDLLTARL